MAKRQKSPRKSSSGGAGCWSLIRKLLRLVEIGIYLAIFGAVAAVLLLAVLFHTYSHDLPSLDALDYLSATNAQENRWSQSTQILAYDGTVLGEFYEEDRSLIAIDQVPLVMQQALIAIEDQRFDRKSPNGWVRKTAWLRNAGVDPIGLARAIFTSVATGKRLGATSTITQQLALNLFLKRERSLKRKMQEMILAYRIENTYTRDEIMERYLNKIFFGNQAYGLHSAALRYFGVDLKKPGATLTLGQAAMLAGLAKAPSAYAPHRHPQAAEQRQKLVLRRMTECGYITAAEAEAARKEFWKTFKPEKVNVPDRAEEEVQIKVEQAGFFLEYVRQELLANGLTPEQIYRGGFRVKTTLVPQMQRQAEAAMRTGLARLSKEIASRRISLVKGPLEGALVAVDTQGHILAMVGGSEWSMTNQFNRAVQARRQAGSSFKPIVYYTAIASGNATLATVLRDEEFVVPGTEWSPKNYDGQTYGPVLPRMALAKSLNIAAVRMLLAIDPDPATAAARVIDAARDDLGMDVSGMRPYPSIVLGAFEVSPLDMCAAYATWLAEGTYTRPYPILEIKQSDGKDYVRPFLPVTRTGPNARETAFLMRELLQGVVQYGTAASAVGSTMNKLKIQCAGKTGTTDDYADAWYVGFSPNICCAVWVGFDVRRTMGRGMTGGHVAAPIWTDFMRNAEPTWRDFAKTTLGTGTAAKFPGVPKGIVSFTICSLTGLAPSQDCPESLVEYFLRGTAPNEICAAHSDPLALQDFLYGDKAPYLSDTGLDAGLRWPDTALPPNPLLRSRERLKKIFDAEAPTADTGL